MYQICIFLPAFIGLLIYINIYEKKRDIIQVVCHYFIYTLLINTICISICHLIFKYDDLTFNLRFTIKYILLASSISLIAPFIIHYIIELIKYIINIIKSGIDKNNKFHFKIMYNKNKKILDLFIFLTSGILFFYILDIYIRIIAINISGFYSLIHLSPFLFTLLYLVIYLFIIYFLPRKIETILSIIILIINLLLFIIHYFLLEIKGEAFSIYELHNTNEGMQFLNFLVKKTNILFILIILLLITLAIIHIVFLNKVKKNKTLKLKIKYIIILLFFSIGSYFCAVKSLLYIDHSWEEISSPRYYYTYFINPKKSLSVLGLYEYTMRDIHFYIKNRTTTYGSKAEIETTFAKYKSNYEKNEYTGIFKDKNLIMIMLESIDYVTIDEKAMPKMYKMMKEGWSFPNRYSALSTGGSTIATEYASMSGLYYDSVYYNNINHNNYPYSLPNLFNNNGYKISSVHENNGRYYNRDSLHKLLGFNNSYFLYDILDNPLIYNDAQIIDNDEIYNKIVSNNEKFMSFIITINAHGPYDTTNTYCEVLGNTHTEIECFNHLAKQTDDMLAHLLQKLEKDNILDDTVIVLYTDHQAYSYNYSTDYLNSLTKIDDNHNIKAIPFVIYNSDIKHKEFNDILVNDIDIVPTIFNLFDIKYDPNIYLGRDLFSNNHKNVSIFLDYTWFDGTTYSGNQNIDYNSNEFKENTIYTKDILELNKMILSNNYYAYIKEDK